MISPFVFQSWNHISFLHWKYPAALLQTFLPPDLEIDQFQGSAWISVTPFLLENLRPSYLPSIPWFSRFPEINVRTYVRGPAGDGIWFFSLDAARLGAVVGARMSFGLPYFWSDTQILVGRNVIEYRTKRTNSVHAEIRVEPGPPIDRPDPLSIFLTARYRLYAMRRGRLITAAVEHRPWPLQQANILLLDETLTATAGLKAGHIPDVVHFSSGVDVRVAAPQEAIPIGPRLAREVPLTGT